MDDVKNNIQITYYNFVKWKKQCIFLLFFYTIAISSILRSNYGYVDDIGRIITGSRGWDDFSRYVNQILSVLIHGDAILNDISPLPQLLAIAIITIASLILAISFSKDGKPNWFSIVAVVPVGLSPYFLECLSFKFDSPYMALSVLFSVLPLLFIEQERKYYAAVVFVSALLMCMTYQASSGIFIVCIFLLHAVKWNRGLDSKGLFKNLFVSLLSYFVALVIFKYAIMHPAEYYEYVSVQVASSQGLINNVANNIHQYFKLIYQDSTMAWRIIICALIISFIQSFVMSSKRHKINALIVATITLVVCTILSYGVYLVLAKPSFFPRAMYGFYVVIALVGLISVNELDRSLLGKLACLFLFWSFFTFSMAYGNALSEQKRYDEFRIAMVLQDLQLVPNLNNEQKKNMQLKGSVGFSPVVKRMAERYKILERLVPIRLHAGMPFGEYYIFYYYNFPGVVHVPNWSSKRVLIDDKDMTIFKDTSYHTIKIDCKNIVLIFK